MTKTITLERAPDEILGVIKSLPTERTTTILDVAGKPVASVLSPDEFRSFHRNRIWDTVDRVRDRHADIDDDELLADATELVKEVRKERRSST